MTPAGEEVDEGAIVKKESRIRRASRDTAETFKNRPVPLALAGGFLTLPGPIVGAIIQIDELDLVWRLAINIAGASTAVLLVVVLFLSKVASARRHQLEDRVGALEVKIAEQADQVLSLTGQERRTEQALMREGQESLDGLADFDPEPNGDFLVFAVADVKAELGRNQQQLQNGIDTNEMWGLGSSLTQSAWKRHRYDLQGSDVYDACAAAYQEVDRVNSIMRLRRRDTQATDNLEGALARVTTAVDALEAFSTNAKPRRPTG